MDSSLSEMCVQFIMCTVESKRFLQFLCVTEWAQISKAGRYLSLSPSRDQQQEWHSRDTHLNITTYK